MLQSSISFFNIPVVIVKFLAVSRPEFLPEAQQIPYLTVAPSNGGEHLVNGCTWYEAIQLAPYTFPTVPITGILM